MKKKIKVGIDIGGSHVSIGLVDDKYKIINQFEKDFTVKEKNDLINVAIDYIVNIIDNLKNEYEFDKVSIAMAGSISNGIIRKSVNLGIENFDIAEILEKRIEKEVVVNNDAKCVSIAEYKLGNCSKFKDVLFLALGTGIGGGYIYNGELLRGKNFDGLEFGHMVINSNGIECRCGKRGCFEKYASILVFKNKVIDRLNLSYDISGPVLREYIDKYENQIQDIKNEYIKNLSIGITNLINIFEPEAIIIGGGFTRYDYLFMDDLKKYILKNNLLMNSRKDIEIQTAKLGNDAGIIGATML